MTFRFTKMHGLGNDFVVVDADVTIDRATVIALCHRHFGVGADGVLRVGVADELVFMEYWNADGSDAEMCGNGLRCVAAYAAGRHWLPADGFIVETPVGQLTVRQHELGWDAQIGEVADHGEIRVGGRMYRRISVGNPHAVTEVEDLRDIDVAGEGRMVETDPGFPMGTNVEFVVPKAADRLQMRVWERGSGETMACGTGMVAAAAAHRLIHGGDGAVTVEVPGGEGLVRFDGSTGWLAGPAVRVYEGTWTA